jgi:class 3 adenylate cyclase/tetratricopeptide (TPR) repeat protein
MRNLPTGTVTFLFTDIEGSTRLWEQFPKDMKHALARHDALLREAIEARGGCVFKTIGDAVCAAFATALGAVTAALVAQRAIHKEDWGTTGPLKVRMALHSGVAEERDQDYFGPTVNRVARLLAAGHGGQMLVSQPTAALLRDSLPLNANLRDLGEYRLKDLDSPEHVFQLVVTDLPSDFPPLRAVVSDEFKTSVPTEPPERLVTRFLAQFDHAVPQAIIERAVHGAVQSPLSEVLARCGRGKQVAFVDGMWIVPDEARPVWRMAAGSLLFDRMRAAARAYIDYILSCAHQNDVLDQQHDNIMAMIRWCSDNRCHDEVLKFIEYEKHFKWRGRKRELQWLGERVIEAGKLFPTPHPEWVTVFVARAHVCGRAWIYQRVGQIDKAIDAAKYAKSLDDSIHNVRGSAFDSKCLGNAYRLRRDYDDAERLLKEAISKFSTLRGQYDIEVGDCKTLLARTLFDRGQHAAARAMAQEAEAILQSHQGTKDWQDLQLLLGDLHPGIPARAEAFYRAVADSVATDSVERGCEQYALAHLGLGRFSRHKDPARAMDHFRTAAAQFTKIEELEHAAEAEWLAVGTEVAASAEPRMRLDFQGLEKTGSAEKFRVRMRSWAMYLDDRRKPPPSDRRATRQTAKDTAYWKATIDHARRDIAADPEPWL